MPPTLFRLQAAFGLALIIAGFAFDFAFVTTTANFTASLKSQTASYVWTKYAYELTKSYLFVLGFLNIALALLTARQTTNERPGRIVLALMVAGSILFLAGGFWEARVGPVLKWEPPCYVLTAGLIAVLASLVLEIHALTSGGERWQLEP